MISSKPVSARVLDAAIAWQLSLDSGDGSLVAQEEFAKWLAGDEEHARAWRQLGMLDQRFSRASGPARAALVQSRESLRQRVRKLGRGLASIALVCGLVVFAGESFTLLPMTTDKSSLLNAVSSVEMGLLEDGTAIGDGLATSINRIVEGKAKSKSIILLTDGSNNTGLIAPLTAAEIAKDKGIKVYTIGIGSNGSALSPVGINYYGKLEYDYVKVTIDEQTLQSIARMTGGKYYRATDKNSLEGIFKEIDALEKTKLDISRYHNTEDDYMLWAWLLLAFVGLDIVLRTTVMRNIP